MNKKRVESLFKAFNSYTESGKGINRIAYTDVENSAKHHFMRLCLSKNMSVRMDNVGNVIARKEGHNPLLPALAIGSHIDTVYNGGEYDGLAGIIAGYEVVTILEEEEITLDHPLEIIIFACEESARFGVSTIGSKVMTGKITANELRKLKDQNRISFERALRSQGLSLENIESAYRIGEEFKAFLELHIEQGPILDNEKLDIGIVTAIAAPVRFKITIFGQASHSGTTPMHYRKDALVGASEIIIMLERLGARENINGSVATVGNLEVHPGGMNTVPGEVCLLVDIRGVDMNSRTTIVEALFDHIRFLENIRGLNIVIEKLSEENSVQMHPTIINNLKEVCEQLAYSHKFLGSGAGHDSIYMSSITPTGMIFVPSLNGISHNPKEYSSIEQICKGIEVLKQIVIKLDKEGEM